MLDLARVVGIVTRQNEAIAGRDTNDRRRFQDFAGRENPAPRRLDGSAGPTPSTDV